MDEEQHILHRELYGADDAVTCALCQALIDRHEARAVSGAEVGTPDAEFLWVCQACYRQIRGEEPVEPELAE